MLVLANMLMKSTVDPFDAQESKPYKDNPEIQAMTKLVVAYQDHDIKQFEKILKTNRRNLMDDPFVRECKPPPPPATHTLSRRAARGRWGRTASAPSSGLACRLHEQPVGRAAGSRSPGYHAPYTRTAPSPPRLLDHRSTTALPSSQTFRIC